MEYIEDSETWIHGLVKTIKNKLLNVKCSCRHADVVVGSRYSREMSKPEMV